MQKFAVGFDHRDFALSASTAAAEGRRLDACALKRFKQGLMRADSDRSVRFGKADSERIARVLPAPFRCPAAPRSSDPSMVALIVPSPAAATAAAAIAAAAAAAACFCRRRRRK